MYRKTLAYPAEAIGKSGLFVPRTLRVESGHITHSMAPFRRTGPNEPMVRTPAVVLSVYAYKETGKLPPLQLSLKPDEAHQLGQALIRQAEELSPELRPKLCVLALGNPFDGLTLRGPLPLTEASESCFDHLRDKWEVVELTPYSAEEED